MYQCTKLREQCRALQAVLDMTELPEAAREKFERIAFELRQQRQDFEFAEARLDRHSIYALKEIKAQLLKLRADGEDISDYAWILEVD